MSMYKQDSGKGKGQQIWNMVGMLVIYHYLQSAAKHDNYWALLIITRYLHLIEFSFIRWNSRWNWVKIIQYQNGKPYSWLTTLVYGSEKVESIQQSFSLVLSENTNKTKRAWIGRKHTALEIYILYLEIWNADKVNADLNY